MSAPAIRPSAERSPGDPLAAPRGTGPSRSCPARTSEPSSGSTRAPPGATRSPTGGSGLLRSTTPSPGISRRWWTTRCSRRCPPPGTAT
eukprot:12585210-Alexandrium_andersonii.AAC.1